MRILLISMPSIHVIRWVENLSQSNYELYWFDVMGRGKLRTHLIPETHQYTNWKKRKLPYIKGEFYLSKNYPTFFNKIQYFLEVTANEKLQQIIDDISPDVVHSFELQSCTYPILKTMNANPHLKWIYSCWGSDLYYYGNIKRRRIEIEAVLTRVNFMFSDCLRDEDLALKYGFRGTSLGVVFGGGGYDVAYLQTLKKTIEKRRIILIKGYEHKFGRAINVVKAIHGLEKELQNYDIHVFGTHGKVQEYIENHNLNITVHGRHNLSQDEVLKLMGASLIYIGNSVSDGMPNTLLEAIIMGAFPIQSNPGGATEDVIISQVNGLLIEKPENIEAIKRCIITALENEVLLRNAYHYNSEFSKNNLNYNTIQSKIQKAYQLIANNQAISC